MFGFLICVISKGVQGVAFLFLKYFEVNNVFISLFIHSFMRRRRRKEEETSFYIPYCCYDWRVVVSSFFLFVFCILFSVL